MPFSFSLHLLENVGIGQGLTHPRLQLLAPVTARASGPPNAFENDKTRRFSPECQGVDLLDCRLLARLIRERHVCKATMAFLDPHKRLKGRLEVNCRVIFLRQRD